MAQQLGRLLLIRMGDGASPENFTDRNVCGLRSRTLGFSNNQVDTTVPDCDDPGGPVVKTSIAGIQDRSFSGSGLFDSDAMGKAVADAARLGTINNYQIVIPGYGTLTGPFVITDFTFSGEMEGDMEFSATWNPTAKPDFDPE